MFVFLSLYFLNSTEVCVLLESRCSFYHIFACMEVCACMFRLTIATVLCIFYYTSSISFLFCLHCLLLDSSSFICLIFLFFGGRSLEIIMIMYIFFSVVSFYLDFFFVISHHECVLHSLSKIIILTCVYFLFFSHVKIICTFPSTPLFGKVPTGQ